jgi:NAD(P)H-dependent flavin oxidoreductase YrpB (nitropropane dioxygenase family)
VTVAGSNERHTVGIDPAEILGDTDPASGGATGTTAGGGRVNGARRGRLNGSVTGINGDAAGAPEWADTTKRLKRLDRSDLPEQPLGAAVPERLKRPLLLAIVSANVLAMYLARSPVTRPDGFILEGPVAGGHSAPPRGKLRLSESGEPVYGPRDEIDLEKIAALGLPFWLAGGYATPEALAEARAAGASGIQVGTAFALCRESGFEPELRRRLLEQAVAGTLEVVNAPDASPAGFPFKVARLGGTVADPESYDERERLCDLGYLRTPYEKPNGGVGYRCAAEPVDAYARKGGAAEEATGRRCLCNGLISNIGLAQHRPDGYAEPPLVTLGQDLGFLARLLPTADTTTDTTTDTGPGGTGSIGADFGAADVIRYLEQTP